MKDPQLDTYTDEEIARRDEAIRRAPSTLPQPNPTKFPKPVKPAAEATAGKRGPTCKASKGE